MLEIKVLIIDDDVFTCEVLETVLSNESILTWSAHNALSAYELYLEVRPDILLMDLRLPGKDGYALTREIRAEDNNVGIIHLSSKSELFDRILGLELGADACIPKPFDSKEVIAQIKALYRRVQSYSSTPPLKTDLNPDATSKGSVPPEDSCIIQMGNIKLDTKNRLLYNAYGDASPLSHNEFQMLKAMMTKPGEVFSRDDLLDIAQSSSWQVGDRTVDLAVAKLRNKLKDNGRAPRYLITVHGIGYMFKP